MGRVDLYAVSRALEKGGDLEKDLARVMPALIKEAGRWRPKAVLDFDDLFQAACLGFIAAWHRLRPGEPEGRKWAYLHTCWRNAVRLELRYRLRAEKDPDGHCFPRQPQPGPDLLTEVSRKYEQGTPYQKKVWTRMVEGRTHFFGRPIHPNREYSRAK